MAEMQENAQELAITEAQDGSATVDLPENMSIEETYDDQPEQAGANNRSDDDEADDEDHSGDEEELRAAKRNRRRAKKDLIRRTNQEKDIRLQQLQRENEEFKRRLNQLERNTKAEQITRIEKNIEDAKVRLEYAKMKLAEAGSSGDGNALVEAQTMWQAAQDEVRNLEIYRQRADQELKKPQVPVPDARVQRHAAAWMERNTWYDPATSDPDSRLAKRLDEQLVREGWNPADPDYWDELDARLQKELPHRYNDGNDDEIRSVRRPRNVVASSGREASAAYGGTNRTQFVLSPDRVRAMKEAGAWDNPERKARMIKNFIDFDRRNGRN